MVIGARQELLLMDEAASFKHTIVHLFDAVRYDQNAKDLDQAASKAEGDLKAALGSLDMHAAEISNQLSPLKEDQNEAVRDLYRQVTEFVATAKAQARSRLEKKAHDLVQKTHLEASTERDKAFKSLETFFAIEPIPVIESSISVKLVEGAYHATSRFTCEGGVNYEFGLASQNSKLMNDEFTLAKLGYEVKVPVRFSKTMLKGRVPGFERLDQYTLVDAETTGGKVISNFHKTGNGASIKVVTSGSDDQAFVSIEYKDGAHNVNVMNDPSLRVHTDLDSIKRAMSDVASAMADLSTKKSVLLSLSIDGESSPRNADASQLLEIVSTVMAPKFRTIVKGLPAKSKGQGSQDLTLDYVRSRINSLGVFSQTIARSFELPA